jgi:beta-lactamase superfamily II metal-dependent hydrolase
VDCPTGAADRVIDVLQDHGAKLHTVIVTHLDSDHVGGVLEVLATQPFEQILMPLERALKPLAQQHIRQLHRILKRGGRLGAFADCREGIRQEISPFVAWSLLAPSDSERLVAAASLDRNAGSAVVMLEITPTRGGRTRRLLLGGDAPADTWQRLINDGHDLSCDVFRWPHHGGRLSRAKTEAALLVELSGRTGASSVVFGVSTDNSYGHPRKDVIDVVRSDGARVLCSQVTRSCESGSLSGQVQCAGRVTAHISKLGLLRLHPDVATHATVIAGWDTPMCTPRMGKP